MWDTAVTKARKCGNNCIWAKSRSWTNLETFDRNNLDCLPKWISRNMDVKGDIDKSSFVVGNVVENASTILENIYMYISHPMNRKQNVHGK